MRNIGGGGSPAVFHQIRAESNVERRNNLHEEITTLAGKLKKDDEQTRADHIKGEARGEPFLWFC